MSENTSILVSAIVILTLLIKSSSACPEICTCKWKNGKQTVECSNKNLNKIPSGMDAGTQVLEFSGNNLNHIPEENFLKIDLINLQRIYLARCKLISISESTFKGLTNLVELDLSGNMLEIVPSKAFLDIPNLMRLIMNGNPIKKLKKDSFNHLGFLNTLELAKCDLSLIEEGAFDGLVSLEWLHLSGNKLTTLRGSKVLPNSLKGIELQGNIWECDCHMLEFSQWLKDFNIPVAMQPYCQGPSKFKGKPIRSIPSSELACLPDVSPTNFYLEIAEGKNISLQCHVHAIPEAQVNWSFQGQLLQNDTLIAPGLRLYYFLEEGHEDKRSELLIYNINSEDNGTYICNAKNPAGSAQSNFTIKIIVKEVEEAIFQNKITFPFEYLLAAVVGASILVLILIITIIVLICKCRRYRKRQMKRDKTKEVALSYQQNSKCSMMHEGVEQLPDPLKSTLFEGDRQHSIMFYAAARSSEDLLRTMSPVGMSTQMHSPTSLRRFQLEQNPDLINDTESVGRRRDGDGDDGVAEKDLLAESQRPPSSVTLVHPALVQVPVGCLRTTRKLQTMNSWDPGYTVDPEGYPVDYGLPRMHSVQGNENFYRTLPYNRVAKRHSAANPKARYSREAEFLSRNVHPEAFDHYCPDVRYTVDGYPAKATECTMQPSIHQLPSPPEGYKSDSPAPSSLPCCSTPPVQWPPCVPANLHMINREEQQKVGQGVAKRCVSAQTDSECSISPPPQDAVTLNNKTESISTPQTNEGGARETLTESPDEGYEGEPSNV